MDISGSFRGAYNSREMKVITHIYLVKSLGIIGAKLRSIMHAVYSTSEQLLV